MIFYLLINHFIQQKKTKIINNHYLPNNFSFKQINYINYILLLFNFLKDENFDQVKFEGLGLLL